MEEVQVSSKTKSVSAKVWILFWLLTGVVIECVKWKADYFDSVSVFELLVVVVQGVH